MTSFSLPRLVSATGSIKAASRISPEARFISEKENCFIGTSRQLRKIRILCGSRKPAACCNQSAFISELEERIEECSKHTAQPTRIRKYLSPMREIDQGAAALLSDLSHRCGHKDRSLVAQSKEFANGSAANIECTRKPGTPH
jgi:hypothetical protein